VISGKWLVAREANTVWDSKRIDSICATVSGIVMALIAVVVGLIIFGAIAAGFGWPK
jgi:hypothetical protein